MTALRGSALDSVLDSLGESSGVYARVRAEAEAGARDATRTPLLVVAAVAVTSLVVAVLALAGRR